MERTRSRTPVRDWAEAALKLGLSCGGRRGVCRERAGGCVQNHCISCTHTRACTEALLWPLHWRTVFSSLSATMLMRPRLPAAIGRYRAAGLACVWRICSQQMVMVPALSGVHHGTLTQVSHTCPLACVVTLSLLAWRTEGLAENMIGRAWVGSHCPSGIPWPEKTARECKKRACIAI